MALPKFVPYQEITKLSCQTLSGNHALHHQAIRSSTCRGCCFLLAVCLLDDSVAAKWSSGVTDGIPAVVSLKISSYKPWGIAKDGFFLLSTLLQIHMALGKPSKAGNLKLPKSNPSRLPVMQLFRTCDRRPSAATKRSKGPWQNTRKSSTKVSAGNFEAKVV